MGKKCKIQKPWENLYNKKKLAVNDKKKLAVNDKKKLV